MGNIQKQPSSNENRKRQNQKNTIITTGIITGVAVIAAGIMIAMALVGRPAQSGTPAPQTPEIAAESKLQTASETGSMAVSGLSDSGKTSSTEKKPAASSGAAKKKTASETAKKTASSKASKKSE